MDWPGVHRRTVIAALVLGILLVGAGAVIYRNIDKMSRLEYENHRRFLASAMLNFRRDFTGSLLDLGRAFELPLWTQTTEGLQRQLVDRYQLLLEEGSVLDSISQLSLFVYAKQGPEAFYRFRPEDGVFIEEPLPDSLFELVSTIFRRSARGPARGGISRLELVDDTFFVAIPHITDRGLLRGRRGGPSTDPPFPFPPRPRSNPRGFEGRGEEPGPTRTFLILLELERDYLEEEFVRLKQSYFTRPLLPGFELAITVDPDKNTVYQSDSQLDSRFFSSPDAALPLVTPAGRLFGPRLGGAPERRVSPNLGQSRDLDLVAKHRRGSLKKAIGERRTYDLLEAFGILLLLAAAAITLLVSVHRTRILAKRQMDFVAGISHELSNPLTAIQSAGFNLSKGDVDEEGKIRKYGQMISRESRRLTQMVEQVLSYAGIQTSAGQYDRQVLRMEEIVETVLQEYAPIFEEEEWDVEVQVDEDLPSLSADPKALESCLRNLIDNALKYAAEAKSLRLQVSSKKAPGGPIVEVSVQDKGRGISASELSNIFDPFYRGSDNVASSIPGTGLGLALVKRHVEAHGGRVQVHSKPNEGASFLLTLPAIAESTKARKDGNVC